MSSIRIQVSHESQNEQATPMKHQFETYGEVGGGGGESRDNDLHGRVRGHGDRLGQR